MLNCKKKRKYCYRTGQNPKLQMMLYDHYTYIHTYGTKPLTYNYDKSENYRYKKFKYDVIEIVFNLLMP